MTIPEIIAAIEADIAKMQAVVATLRTIDRGDRSGPPRESPRQSASIRQVGLMADIRAVVVGAGRPMQVVEILDGLAALGRPAVHYNSVYTSLIRRRDLFRLVAPRRWMAVAEPQPQPQPQPTEEDAS